MRCRPAVRGAPRRATGERSPPSMALGIRKMGRTRRADSRMGRPPFGLRWRGAETGGSASPLPERPRGSWGPDRGGAGGVRQILRRAFDTCARSAPRLAHHRISHGDFLNMVRSPISPPCQHIGVWRMLRIEPRPVLPGPSHSYPVQRPHPGGCKKRPRENLTGWVANFLRQSSGCQPVRPSA